MNVKLVRIDKKCECNETITTYWPSDLNDFRIVRCDDCASHKIVYNNGGLSEVASWVKDNIPSIVFYSYDLCQISENILEKCDCGGHYHFMTLGIPVRCIKCSRYLFFGNDRLNLSIEKERSMYVQVNITVANFRPNTV